MTHATEPRSERLPPWLPSWWPYYAFAVSIIALGSLVLGVLGVYTNGRQDAVSAAENKARDSYNRKLLDCFDEFASDLSGGLPPVREATAASGEALSQAMGSLQLGLVKVGSGTFQDDDLQRIIAAFDAYQKANQNLVKVRKENPYPPSPSEFCTVKP